MGIYSAAMTRPHGTKSQLKAQREELVRLRGDMTIEAWAKGLLGVPERTYTRYEQGQRLAPEAVMRLARLSAKKR